MLAVYWWFVMANSVSKYQILLFCAAIPESPSQRLRTEAFWKKFGKSHHPEAALPVAEVDRELRRTEFPQHLPADAARGAESELVSHFWSAGDCECFKFPAAFTYCLENSRALRAVSRRIGGIFYVAARVDFLPSFPRSAAPTAKCE